jgi:nucleotide-binding universal stress UspA family protein
MLRTFGVSQAVLVHVAGSSAAGKRAARRLEAICEQYRTAELSVRPQILTGSPATEIVQAAVAADVDLVGIPWKPKSWLQRSLIGSVTKDLARLCDRPFLVFRGGAGGGEAENDGLSVVYASDLGHSDRTVLPLLENGEVVIDKLTVVHAGHRAPDPEAETARRTDIQERLDQVVERLRSGSVATDPFQVSSETLVGSPRRVLRGYIRRWQPDLAIIGKGGMSHGVEGVLGSVAEDIAYRASASVLIVPGDGSA